MSDYVRKKVIRVIVPKEIYERCDGDDTYYACEEWLTEKQGKINRNIKVNYFELECPLNFKNDELNYYYDYVLFYSNGNGSDNFGRTRALTENEKNKYRQKFLDVGLDIEKSRLVDYCYYNCSECQDYFDETTDEFYNEI